MSNIFVAPTRVRRAVGAACTYSIASLAGLLFFVAPASAILDIPGPLSVTAYDTVTPTVIGTLGEPLTVKFNALGQSYDLTLTPSELFSPLTQSRRFETGVVIETTIPAVFYHGEDTGLAGSLAAISIIDGELSGFVRTDSDVIILVPLARFTGLPLPGTVAFGASDLITELPAEACGVTDHAGDLFFGSRSAGPQHGRRSVERAAPASGYLEVALISDYELYLKHGTDADVHMLSIFNQIAAIVEASHGVVLQASVVDVYATPADPFSNTNDVYGLLNEFGLYRQGEGGAVTAAGLAHLFTGRNLSGNAAGVGYLDVLCDSRYGVSLTADFSTNDYLLTLVAGHEIGHNLSAPHDGEVTSACASEPRGFLMWPSIGNSTTHDFSTCTDTHISSALASAPCVLVPSLDCGNNVLDPGEDCDDGNNLAGDCCSADCSFSALGSICTGDANVCTTDSCDGLGSCVVVNNSAPCDDGDACTLDGICVTGSCTPSVVVTPLVKTGIKAAIKAEANDDKLTVSATLLAGAFALPPNVGGVAFEIKNSGDVVEYDAFIAAEEWTVKKGTKFIYKADGTESPDVNGMVKAKLVHSVSKGTLKVKTKTQNIDLPSLQTAGTRTLTVLVGNQAGGTCGIQSGTPCTSSGKALKCSAP